MCNHPEAQIKIAAEIDDFVERHGRLPLFNERLELPFCISAMKECMRLKPITAFGIPHLAIDDSKFVNVTFFWFHVTQFFFFDL